LIYDYICLYVVGVWIVGVVWEVWVKLWKYEFLVNNEFDDEFVMKWGDKFMFVCVLFAFWCMLTNNKVLETIWGQRGSKSSFMVKIGMGFLGNPKFGLPVWCSLSGELELAMTSCLVQHPCFRRSGYLGVDSDFPKCFFWCVWLLFSLRNLLEHKMDRIKIYFVNQIETYLKNVQEREIFRNSFFSSTMMELWFVYCNYESRMSM